MDGCQAWTASLTDCGRPLYVNGFADPDLKNGIQSAI